MNPFAAPIPNKPIPGGKVIAPPQVDDRKILDMITGTTVVGVLPLPHAILVRRYISNLQTNAWFYVLLYGQVFLKHQSTIRAEVRKIRKEQRAASGASDEEETEKSMHDLGVWDAAKIRLFVISHPDDVEGEEEEDEEEYEEEFEEAEAKPKSSVSPTQAQQQQVHASIQSTHPSMITATAQTSPADPSSSSHVTEPEQAKEPLPVGEDGEVVEEEEEPVAEASTEQVHDEKSAEASHSIEETTAESTHAVVDQESVSAITSNVDVSEENNQVEDSEKAASSVPASDPENHVLQEPASSTDGQHQRTIPSDQYDDISENKETSQEFVS